MSDGATGGSTLDSITTSIAPREQVITTAVTFLQNPNVQRSALNQKQQFLRSKGLTEDEIQLACEKAGAFSLDPTRTAINMDPHNSIIRPSYSYHGKPKSTLEKVKDILSSITMIGGIGYAIYLFYKRFIEPLLFGRKKKTIEESITDLDKKVEKNISDLSIELNRIREELTRSVQYESLTRQITNFKGDLDAIKGLLLNRKQFSAPLLPPSIPAWQLQSQRNQQCETEADNDKNDDAGSGSGSSETEVVTKNSDSSLEIM